MKSYVLLSVSLVLTSCSVMTGNGEAGTDPGVEVGYPEPPVTVADAGWSDPPRPDDASVGPYPDDASVGPYPDDAGPCHHPHPHRHHHRHGGR